MNNTTKEFLPPQIHRNQITTHAFDFHIPTLTTLIIRIKAHQNHTINSYMVTWC